MTLRSLAKRNPGRLFLVRQMECVVCWIELLKQPNKTEAHHLNLGGKAGQKRRGDEFTIPLCQWHHRGIPSDGLTLLDMATCYGPSLARQSKRFRERYGTDDELLDRVNARMK